jgi:copper homeostasis protein
MRPRLLEVIACTAADAVAAEQGGAGRLEVISHFEAGGLTPPLALVREIQAAVRLPLRVMVREGEDFTVSDEAEKRRLCAAAREFAALGVDGLVLGFLRDGQIDLALLERVLACARGVKATFHRAFDELRDPQQAIAQLKNYPQIDRILTNGGAGDWGEKLARLAGYERAARPEIAILIGGGVDARAIELIRAATDICEFHAGRAVRAGQSVAGAVEAARVEELIRALGR